MKLIIEISEEEYNRIKILDEHGMSSDAIKIILNGTPLGKVRAEIDGIQINGRVDEHTLFIRGGEEVKQTALDIIDKYISGKENK